MTSKRVITVVSAHEGATTWSNMIRHISESTAYEVRSFHQYDDATYRSAVSRSQRLALRLKTFLIFPLRFMIHARRLARSSDALLIVTSPFFMPVLAATFVPRRTSLLALMNDIYPEGLVAKGIIRRDGALERGLKRMFHWAFGKFSALVFIAEHHRRFVMTGSARTRSVVIPVSAHSDPFVQHDLQPAGGPVVVTYCGTLGMMHETATFLGWLRSHGGGSPVRFVFHTSGAAKRKFEGDVKALLESGVRAEIRLGGALAEPDWVRVMKASQVGLVFQDSGAAKIIFPSKLAGILAAGQAVLLVAETDSDIARLVSEHDCGWVVSPGDIAGFERSARQMLDPQVLLEKRRNAFQLGHTMFSKEAVTQRWVELFNELTGLRAQPWV